MACWKTEEVIFSERKLSQYPHAFQIFLPHPYSLLSFSDSGASVREQNIYVFVSKVLVLILVLVLVLSFSFMQVFEFLIFSGRKS